MTKREEKAAEKAAKVEQLTAQLKARADAFRENDAAFLQHLRQSAKFHRYSVNNQFLIMLQTHPHGTVAVRSFKQWLGLGRQVRKGSTAIYILAPRPYTRTNRYTGEEEDGISFKYVPVFPYEVTDPVEGADEVWEPYTFPVLTDSVGDQYVEGLIRSLEGEGHHVECFDGGRNRLGRFYVPEGDESIFRIELDVSQPVLQQLQTLVHELAHAMHWVLMPETLIRWPKARVEFIAEAASYAVLSELGFDASAHAVSYIAGIGTEKGEKDEDREKVIMKLVVDIVGSIMGRLEAIHAEPVVIDIEAVA